jgi:predicted phosphodiesterase
MRFEGNDRINVNPNLINDDIMAFSVLDGKYVVGGVHGHKDKPGKVVENLTMMTKIKFDLILTAHLHHFSADEQNETVVVSNGSLMGTDKYAMDLRLTSKPSQNIILVNDKSVVDSIHRVVLN